MSKAYTDWEAIESLYRAGLLSVREIARLHDISDKSVRNKAREKEWQRDLTAKVREAAKSALVRAESAPADQSEDPRPTLTDTQIVDRNASIIVNVVLSHRKGIGRMHTLTDSLLEELTDQTLNRDLYSDLGELLRSEDDKGADKRNDLYQKIVSGAGRVDSMKKLAEVKKILIGLERQAFNIGDEPERPADALTALLDTITGRGSRLTIKAEAEPD